MMVEIRQHRVVAPLLQAFLENRLWQLIGAGGAHAAFRLMELDTCRLEFQPVVLEHPAHTAFQILNHLLHTRSRACRANGGCRRGLPPPDYFPPSTLPSASSIDAVMRSISRGAAMSAGLRHSVLLNLGSERVVAPMITPRL